MTPLADRVRRIVEEIPPGRALTYGDIADLLGTGARQVGRVMASLEPGAPWWRVVNAQGRLPSWLVDEARESWRVEEMPLGADGDRVALARARLSVTEVARLWPTTMGRMRIMFAGTPDVAVPSLQALLDSEHEVIGVITRPDAPRGRGKRLHPSPVAEVALEAGIEVLRPAHPKDPEFQQRLRELAPDCIPVVAYGALVPRSALEIPTHGWVNLHFSLLPRWRGAAPVQRAIMAGDAETGACVFQLVEELDAGDVFGEIRRPIEPTDTAGDLLDALAFDGARLLVETLDAIGTGTASATPQPEEGITLAPKLGVEDGRIDWSMDAEEIDRRIRGCSPAPGAWTTWRGERFKVHAARPAAGAVVEPGVIVGSKKWLQVGTGSRPLELELVQPPGKKPMRAADWARGVTIEPGERFGA